MKYLNDLSTVKKLSNISGIIYEDIANGEGIRTSVFFSGCTFNCPGCQNKKLHDFNYGKQMDEEAINSILDSLNSDYIDGVSILGGEPLHEYNKESVLYLVNKIKEIYPSKDIWLWTGYTSEELKEINDSIINEIISKLDVIIVGRYIAELHEYNLQWMGSSNQKIIRLT